MVGSVPFQEATISMVNIYQNVNERENGMFACVPFCSRSLGPVERCVSKLLFRADFLAVMQATT